MPDNNHPTAFNENDVYALHFTLERHGAVKIEGRMVISDMLTVSYDDVDNTYMVYNPDGSPDWTSVHRDRNMAILLYLQRRLGIAEKVEENSNAQ